MRKFCASEVGSHYGVSLAKSSIIRYLALNAIMCSFHRSGLGLLRTNGIFVALAKVLRRYRTSDQV